MYVECEICGEPRKVPDELAQAADETDVDIIDYVCNKCARTDEIGLA